MDNSNNECYRVMIDRSDFSDIDASFSKLEYLDITLKWNIYPRGLSKNIGFPIFLSILCSLCLTHLYHYVFRAKEKRRFQKIVSGKS